MQKHGLHFKEYLKKSKKIGVHQQQYGLSLKFVFLEISVTFSLSRKTFGIKNTVSSRQKTHFY